MVLGENKRVIRKFGYKDEFQSFINDLHIMCSIESWNNGKQKIFDTFYVDLPPVNCYYSVNDWMRREIIRKNGFR